MLSQILRSRVSVPTLARGLHFTAIRASYPVSKTGKPLQPFMRFSKEKRAEILKANPNLSVPETGRELGKLWKELSEEERERYKQEYFRAKGE